MYQISQNLIMLQIWNKHQKFYTSFMCNLYSIENDRFSIADMSYVQLTRSSERIFNPMRYTGLCRELGKIGVLRQFAIPLLGNGCCFLIKNERNVIVSKSYSSVWNIRKDGIFSDTKVIVSEIRMGDTIQSIN